MTRINYVSEIMYTFYDQDDAQKHTDYVAFVHLVEGKVYR